MSDAESEVEYLPNLSQTLINDISELYLEADDYNVNLHIGYEPNVEVFKAHSVILRARSSYFRAALSANWSWTVDFDASIVEENLVELLHAADELTLLELVETIQDHIIFMDSEWLEKNCDKLLKSIMHNQMLKKLRKFCEDFMSSVPEKFFKLYDFSGLEEEIPLNQILPKELKDDLEMYFIIPDCKPTSQVLPPRNNDQNSVIISIKHKAFLASWINGNNETINLQYPINLLSRIREDSFAILDNADENIGFGRGDLQVFKRITTKRYYSKELLDHKTFEIEEFEVFQVIK
ncbi:5791_t:CDS:2 [Diversispora eburnea]|uniref:5791_t:CDS:1 n=1 Tax=Diversispora eburnea TaxID=1213867 RepID=A0A9N9F4N2_9GLOM|nr:5791_t:CDS:2 [Diversispora eburnea]